MRLPQEAFDCLGIHQIGIEAVPPDDKGGILPVLQNIPGRNQLILSVKYRGDLLFGSQLCAGQPTLLQPALPIGARLFGHAAARKAARPAVLVVQPCVQPAPIALDGGKTHQLVPFIGEIRNLQSCARVHEESPDSRLAELLETAEDSHPVDPSVPGPKNVNSVHLFLA